MEDIILTGGLVVDGTGQKPYRANVCVKDGKISRITTEAVDAAQQIDVTGLVVSPGFIDPHSHSDMSHMNDIPMLGKVAQGVTLEIAGNCGTSAIPGLENQMEEVNRHIRERRGRDAFASVADYAQAGNEIGAPLHYGTLVGHSNLRLAVMGFVNRDPEPAEMACMEELLDREMARGAFGMSLGLIYPPSAFSKPQELIRLAKVVARYDGILAVHMRNEGAKIFEAVEELLEIVRQSGVHLEISHLKLAGKPQWGWHGKLLEKLREARAQGLRVNCDQYPFLASETNMSALVPHWAHEGGNAAMVQRLDNREGTILAEIAANIESRAGAEAVLIVNTFHQNQQWEGKRLSELAQEMNLSPEEAVRHVLMACKGRVQCVYFTMNEADMLAIMAEPFVCVGSDGSSYSHDPSVTVHSPHPRTFAAFVRFFQTVREKNVMPLETAVHKATGLTAQILGIRDRGVLREGMVADIAVFDPETIGSVADYREARVWPTGVHHVLVNGVPVILDGKYTGVRPGRVLLKSVL